MPHYSEMDFLFSNQTNNDYISRQLNNASYDNQNNIFDNKKTVIYKQKKGNTGTSSIKNYIKDNVYKNDTSNANPYIKLINDFDQLSKGLKIKAADLAYLKELGVYPINRMAILRRFPEGCFVSENLEEMNLEPISTIIGWIKPDQGFGSIGFNEQWSTTPTRFDQVLVEIIQKAFKTDISSALPIPDFAQGVLFEVYKKLELTDRGSVNQGVDEGFEYYDPLTKNTLYNEDNNTWGLNNIPIGNPNVLQEGPIRSTDGQNIQSQFTFDLETTYEQKLIGEVDPGSAMLDILDNIYAMGTSNMVFYWGDNSPRIQKLQSDVLSGKANNIIAWWDFVKNLAIDFWKLLTEFFVGAATKLIDEMETVITPSEAKIDKEKLKEKIITDITNVLSTILTSTIAIHRFKLRGSIELMVGGKMSSTPWYLTLGNPYSPWLSTNHIVVKTASFETSPEMGFNDQPQWLKVKFTCQFSRALGKQELMRMFNNTYRRTYSTANQTNYLKKLSSTQLTANSPIGLSNTLRKSPIT